MMTTTLNILNIRINNSTDNALSPLSAWRKKGAEHAYKRVLARGFSGESDNTNYELAPITWELLLNPSGDPGTMVNDFESQLNYICQNYNKNYLIVQINLIHLSGEYKEISSLMALKKDENSESTKRANFTTKDDHSALELLLNNKQSIIDILTYYENMQFQKPLKLISNTLQHYKRILENVSVYEKLQILDKTLPTSRLGDKLALELKSVVRNYLENQKRPFWIEVKHLHLTGKNSSIFTNPVNKHTHKYKTFLGFGEGEKQRVMEYLNKLTEDVNKEKPEETEINNTPAEDETLGEREITSSEEAKPNPKIEEPPTPQILDKNAEKTTIVFPEEAYKPVILDIKADTDLASIKGINEIDNQEKNQVRKPKPKPITWYTQINKK